MEDCQSIKRWFNKPNEEARYRPKTQEVYLEYMELFCSLSKRTPDELANVTSDEALRIQIALATVMKEKLHLREYSITQRINALHSFWRYSGVKLTTHIMKYSGTPWLLRQSARRR